MQGSTNDNFNNAAEAYDKEFTFSHVGIAQREKVWSYFDHVIKTNQSLDVLELNCGTGEDAIRIAKHGHKILATDISTRMLDIAKSKVKRTNSNILFDLVDLRTVSAGSFKSKFDVVFSNFGGLNCLSPQEMERLGNEINLLLKPTGKLVMIIMPKNCVWETGLFLRRLRFKQAFRRRSAQFVNVSGSEVKTWYYNPKDLVKLLGLNVKSKMVKPVGLFIPPSYLESFAIRHQKLFSVLKWLERNIASFGWQAPFSDHYYIEFAKS